MKMNKSCKILAIAMSLLLVISGCGSQNSEDSLSINIVTMFAGEDSSATSYQTLISSYASQTGIAIYDNSEVSSQEWKSKVTEGILSGMNVPDVLFFFTGADASSMILDNQFVSLAEIQQEYPTFASNIRPSTTEFMKEFDNQQYAVPVKGFWEGLFCNVDLFEAYDLELPTTWSTFITAIEVFRENDVTPIAVSMNEVPHYWIEHLVLSAGGAANHKLNPYTYVPQTWVNGFQQMVNLYEMGAFSEDTLTNTNTDAVNAFANKEAAMMIEGSWTLASIKDKTTTVILPIPSSKHIEMEVAEEVEVEETTAEEDVEADEEIEIVAQEPVNTDIISGFSSGFYITRAAWENPEKRDAVVNFVSYLTSNEAIASLCQNGGAPAADVQISGQSTTLDMSVMDLQSEANEALMPIDSSLHTDAWSYIVSNVPLMMEGQVSPLHMVTEVSTINHW
ncbi:MAG: extracellular solute-binding protein [Bacillota bacterium]